MFLTFEVGENGKRVYESVKWWALLYYTKRWSGLDHPLTYLPPIFNHCKGKRFKRAKSMLHEKAGTFLCFMSLLSSITKR
jgi:hypothetical protein